ncbi:MAG: rhodanese-like domain-containing protein [Bdellovibrionales bacterium]|nr:rhodanese-like domain-containing protein [Bdellovibrionales bacterium]
MDLKSFQMLEFINSRLSNIEKNIARIDEKLDFSITLQRNHLVRVKNGEEIDDHMILMGRPYNDITPQRAWSIYNNPNIDFFVLDVTSKTFKGQRLEEAVHIPIEELNIRFTEIPSKTVPILVISENGLRSIQACELLVKKGFFNINNVSGGYEFWPGKNTPSTSPSGNADV